MRVARGFSCAVSARSVLFRPDHDLRGGLEPGLGLGTAVQGWATIARRSSYSGRMATPRRWRPTRLNRCTQYCRSGRALVND